jgi:hypothetical protein
VEAGDLPALRKTCELLGVAVEIGPPTTLRSVSVPQVEGYFS